MSKLKEYAEEQGVIVPDPETTPTTIVDAFRRTASSHNPLAGALITTACVMGDVVFSLPHSALSDSSARLIESKCQTSDPPPRISLVVFRVMEVTMCSGRL